MNESKSNGIAEITAEDHIHNAHIFLKKYLSEFDNAKRGGIHDFIEITLANMINSAINNIDSYLKDGHRQVNAAEITTIVADSFQDILDGIKRNLETMQQVNFV